jgi:carboxyl-terminal processing protease
MKLLKFFFGVLALAMPLSAAVKNPELDGKISNVVGRVLERYHYLQKPLNDEISQQMLKNYLSVLDSNRLVFLQKDIDEFNAKYGTYLDNAVLSADSAPAFEIFDRFILRLQEKTAMAEKLLQEKQDFTGADTYAPDREKAAWPVDETETEKLWRSRIKFQLLQGRLAKEKPENTVKTISKRYARSLKMTKELEDLDILETYLTALTHAYDPHTDYLSPREAENFSINNIKLSLSGIGAILRTNMDGYAEIVSLVPGGPADLDKRLKPKDRITLVQQEKGEPVDVVDMNLNKVVDMIRGKRNTKVILTVIPAGAPDDSVRKVITIVRDEIKLTEQQAKAQVIEHTGTTGMVTRVGVINLPTFYEDTAEDVAKLITRLKTEKVSSIILDLRRNGGGLLDQAQELVGLFVPSGPVVQVRDMMGKVQLLDTNDTRQVYNGPLAVLVSRLSASASEIVAGALQDYGRAVVIGDQSTHGKGTVQTLVPLERFSGFGAEKPGEIKITVQKFYRISGGSTQKKGVIPDVVLPSILDYLEIGESSLPNCLPWDEIQKASYTRFNLVAPHLPEIQKRSGERVAKSTDFSYVREDIDLRKKKIAEKEISLNEARRKKEKDELTQIDNTRKKERTERKSPRDKVLEITLTTVEKNGPAVDVSTKPAQPSLAELMAAADEDETDGEKSDEKTPDIDVPMDEAVNIAVDYAELLAGKNSSTVTVRP